MNFIPFKMGLQLMLTAFVQPLLLYNCLPTKTAATSTQPNRFSNDSRWIIVITPTFARTTQAPEMTRLAQTLRNVRNLHWIVVEDAKKLNPGITRLLYASGLSFSHLFRETSSYQVDAKVRNFPRGVDQRNLALAMIRYWLEDGTFAESDPLDRPGYHQFFGEQFVTRAFLPADMPPEQFVFYFADDDNTYSLRLFEQMRKVTAVGMWNVGLIAQTYEGPLCRVKGNATKVAGFRRVWPNDRRRFPIDMAGFGVNLDRFLRRPTFFEVKTKNDGGYLETDFLTNLGVSIDELQPVAGCERILVWHTQTKAPKDSRMSRSDQEWP